MTKLSLDAQAAAIRSVMRFGLSVSDRKHLEEAERTLKALSALRALILESAKEREEEEEEGPDIGDHFCVEIVKVLDLPTGE